MSQPVIAGAAFAAGLRTEFLSTYDRPYSGLGGALANVMKQDIPSTRENQDFFYWESAPRMVRWVRGQTMSEKNFRGIAYNVVNHEWARAIPWHYADRSDDQTRGLMDRARKLGDSARLLDERIFFQIITGATDNDLLPAIPNAPDGAGLYATTAGGVARFGVTNGNLLTGSGIATAEAIRTDIYTAKTQFLRMQDTEGELLHDESEIDGGLTLFYNVQNAKVVAEALKQPITALAASTAQSNAGVTNIILADGLKITPVGTARITDNDMYVVLNSAEPKPVFSMLREAIQDVVETWQNSDLTRRTGIESIRWWLRKGYGVNAAYNTIKINN